MARFNQTQPVQVTLWGQAGGLLELTMQCPQRQRKMICQIVPAHLVGKMIVKPGDQLVETSVIILRPFRQAAFTQQHQQLHKQQFAVCPFRRIRRVVFRFKLADKLPHLRQHRLINAPV